MIDLTQTQIAADALQHLPPDWPQQLEDGLNSNYLVGYDADLDEAHVWFSTDRSEAVQVLLSPLLDVTIDDETEAVIGFVVRQFAQVALAIKPHWNRFTVRDHVTGYPRLPDDIPMTPIKQFSMNIPTEVFTHTLLTASHSVAA